MAGLSGKLYRLRRISRRLWVRTCLISALAVIAALTAEPLSPLLPPVIAKALGGSAVSGILEILASSMLAVTIFSLSVMVSARQSASAQTTPRSHKLIQQDPTTHTVLATFLGAFIFSLVSLVIVSTGIYDASAASVIMLAALVVIGLVVAAMLRWIDHISDLGSVEETTRRVEAAAIKALRLWGGNPNLGGAAFAPGAEPPEGGTSVFAERTGYIGHVDVPALSGAARAVDGGRVHVLVQPGDMVAEGEEILRLTGGVAPERCQDGVTIRASRDFEQDPRYGVEVLSEIGQRALSPGINDPGTALDVVTALLRVLMQWQRGEHDQDGPAYPGAFVRPLSMDDLVRDSFDPLARDGADKLEVQIALQRALGSLAGHPDGELAAAARSAAGRAREAGLRGLIHSEDEERLRRAAV